MKMDYFRDGMSPKEQSLPIRNNYAESVYIKFEICKVYENIYIYIQSKNKICKTQSFKVALKEEND